MAELTDEARLYIDLELPPEAWDLATFDLKGEQIDDVHRLLRLAFWTGYERGQSDPDGALRKEVQAKCGSTV